MPLLICSYWYVCAALKLSNTHATAGSTQLGDFASPAGPSVCPGRAETCQLHDRLPPGAGLSGLWRGPPQWNSNGELARASVLVPAYQHHHLAPWEAWKGCGQAGSCGALGH